MPGAAGNASSLSVHFYPTTSPSTTKQAAATGAPGGGQAPPGAASSGSTLCAAKVPEDKVDLFVETVNALPGVTHHYRRNHAYNYWFTLICPSPTALVQVLAEIEKRTGIDIIHMRATKTFKINASFQL